MIAEAGAPAPLGAVFDGSGVNFALFSAHATAVDLCLFDPEGRETRCRLPSRTGNVWHGRLAGLLPGQAYLFRVHGPWRPEKGHRFDPERPLLDPYAKLLSGPYRPGPPLAGAFPPPDALPRGIVAAPPDPPCHDRPCRPWRETVIYEAHVRGLTRLHPQVPPALRGTYAALGHPAVIEHLLRLGVTALELLPIQAIADEPALLARGLVNYWGYSTLNYFAPEPRYFGPLGPVGLKQAVRALHGAGIEVILDIVLNHTAEGGEDGPVLSFRGIDNASYYKSRPGEPGRLLDVTGCGNSLDLGHPAVRRLAIDALRHWAEEYGVDGFRFDLAPALARDVDDFDPHSAFFAAIEADPALSGLKLIAEPWDLGRDGYRLGGFPTGWGEWNDRARDALRAFWRGDGRVPDLAEALAGSPRTFPAAGRSAQSSINYVSSHDGFTLRDLVSHARRHNFANGEGNRDGHPHELSQNFGHEGATSDPAVLALRARTARNLLASLVLARGVPMLLAGDEVSRSQGGNNNAYAQDNRTSWIDWEKGPALDPSLPDFVAGLLRLRRECLLAGWETGIRWLAPEGREMGPEDWQDADRRCLGMRIGEGPGAVRLLVLMQAGEEEIAFRLPPEGPWRLVLDTGEPEGEPAAPREPEAGGTFLLQPRSLVLFLNRD
ncbi:glycogen debranching protein GlgX [Enterovirga sp.]|uniref:glycogen debranching protein GlgX n=1 Tax=Enterovirga sp. TaxID=2026350 RepID=UPI002C8844E9|nr:glycogen debranching protein GlgX [Enterovirga sp.]HMO28991.1 glycogen debranching protein GlgX [Enterovirga sp.]